MPSLARRGQTPPARADASSPVRGSPRRAARRRACAPSAATTSVTGGLPFGQRAGLVDDQRLQAPRLLQRRRIADQHAHLRAAAGADHDRRRRRQAERAGAGDHQHRDRIDQRRRGSAGEPPRHAEGQRGDRHHDRHEHAGDAVGEPLDRRLRALRLGDQPDDAGEQRRAAHARRLAGQQAVLVQRAGEHLGAGAPWPRRGSRRSACSRRRPNCRRAPCRRPGCSRPRARRSDRRSRRSPSGTSTTAPPRSTRAVFGCSRRSPSSAADVPAFARASSSLPSSTSVITAAPASK